MKKVLLIFFILSQFYLYGQAPNPKWISVMELQGETVLIDTSNIKLLDSQISLLLLYIYKKPIQVDLIKKEVKSIKSQILINLINKSYSVIGSLYYDENQRIVGEKNSSGTTLNSELFALPLDSNTVMLKILEKCVEILKIESIPEKEPRGNDNPLISRRLPPLIDHENKITETKTEDKNILPVQPEQAKQINNVPKPSTNIISQRINDYNFSNESNPKGTIFTDGNKYCFQVSSWKNKSKADNEVTRLKGSGHNAFITEVNLPGRGTWYRVRIGYFNSLSETEIYLSNFTE